MNRNDLIVYFGLAMSFFVFSASLYFRSGAF